MIDVEADVDQNDIYEKLQQEYSRKGKLLDAQKCDIHTPGRLHGSKRKPKPQDRNTIHDDIMEFTEVSHSYFVVMSLNFNYYIIISYFGT